MYFLLLFIDCYRVLNKEPFHLKCLPLHIALLVELKKPNGKFL